jgi:hypothetical protein
MAFKCKKKAFSFICMRRLFFIICQDLEIRKEFHAVGTGVCKGDPAIRHSSCGSNLLACFALLVKI